MPRLLIVVAAALIDADGRVLLSQRPEGKAQAGLWEFPGGKIEPGESPETALIRELKEELDIDVAAACLAPFAFASESLHDVHLLMPLYVCRKWRGAPRPIEARALAWARPAEFGAYSLTPADRPMASQLRDLL